MTPKSKELINDLIDKEILSYDKYWMEKNKNEFIEAKREFNKLKTK